ncbi:hypothetical protein [Cryobacterium sp. Hb1]|uniref:hypothetical protein n=1 Tax=Cryobacterium sp. Hb1 TaxID=1259147 RepID=UPI00106BF696|nr:hypothetical protein [Cryobacterium sp. Hb1]TFD71106.1 hypothetical protein E3T38_04465 [Cryobacterium sp. Hb1]
MDDTFGMGGLRHDVDAESLAPDSAAVTPHATPADDVGVVGKVTGVEELVPISIRAIALILLGTVAATASAGSAFGWWAPTPEPGERERAR